MLSRLFTWLKKSWIGSGENKSAQSLSIHVPPPNLEENEAEGTKFWDDFEESGKNGTYINTYHPVFQQGRYLYEAQVLYTDAEAWRDGRKATSWTSDVTPERVVLICKRYCQLINALGQLRADYNTLREIVEGKRKRTEKGDFYTYL